MRRESKCQHDIDEQEIAVWEYLCPLCLEAKLVKVSTLLHDLLTQNIPTLQLSLKDADDKLEAVRGWCGMPYTWESQYPRKTAPTC